MLCTTEIMAISVNSDMNVFLLNNVTWAICLTYHMVLESLTRDSIGSNILFDITSIAGWNKRRSRQH